MKKSMRSLASIGLLGFFVCGAPAGAAEPPAKLEESIIFSRTGGLAADVMKKCVESGFTKRTNVRVDFEAAQAAQGLAKVIAQRNSPTIDVLWTDASNEFAGARAGVFIPLNASLVPNLVNVDPKFAPQSTGAPITISVQGIQYNTEIFKKNGWAPPTSYKDLFDPKHKGHVGIYGLGAGGGQYILAVGGYLEGGSAENFDAAFSFVKKAKPNLYTIFEQAPQVDAALLNGSAYISYSNAARPFTMMQSGDPVAFVQPEEGVVAPQLALQLVKGAPHPNAALAFIDWVLSQEGQNCLVAAGYPPVINGINIDPKLAPYLAVQRKVIPVNWEVYQNRLPELLLRWNKEIAG